MDNMVEVMTHFACIFTGISFFYYVTAMIPYLTSPLLNAIPHVEHGFFTRQGGSSTGCYSSLNTALKKDDQVHANRRRICGVFNLEALGVVSQLHTNIAHVITKPFDDETVGDALVTATPNLLLGIKTADCVPILLADKARPIVGAVHAGWKGALDGIIEAAVEKMRLNGATDIVAALGPCIWQESFEVDQEFEDRFGSREFFSANRFDLPGYVTARLRAQGIKEVDPSPADTFADEERFFSYRRKTVRNEADFGNQMSVICTRI